MRLQILSLTVILLLSILIPSITIAQTSISDTSSTQIIQTLEGSLAYIEMTTPDEVYSYRIPFNPPDGISKLLGIEVSIQGDFLPTTVIKVNLDGSSCEPRNWQTPKWEIAGYRTVFECKNLANEKTKELAFSFTTSQESRNVKVWYKINYYNDWNLPSIIEKSVTRPSLSMFGTEYSIGDSGTIFVQLKDNGGFPIVNGSCYIDIYYPNMGNLSHPQWIYNAPMIYKTGSDGLFYYDLTIPNIQGIYMLSGTCNYEYLSSFLYPEDSVNQSIIEPIKGTYDGNTMVLNSKEDGLYTRCTSAPTVPQGCIADYTFQLYDTLFESNITKIDIYYMGESTIKNANMKMSIYNYSNGLFYVLPNSLTFNGLAVSANPSGLSDFLSNSLRQDGNNLSDFIIDKKIKIRLNTTGGTSFRNWNNWLALRILTTEGIVSDVKGSGELHVNNLSSDIWNYPNRSVESNFYELKYKGGTEYSSGETGISSVQFQRISGGNPTTINDGTCNITINYPNGSVFINNANAPYLSGSNGIYRYSFTVPTTYGIYDTDFHCVRGNTDGYASGSFHVSNWTDTILGIPTTLSIINSHISDVNTSIYARLGQIDTKIDSIQTDLLLMNTSLHSDIMAMNISIMNKLYLLQDDLQGITDDIAELSLLIDDINQTTMNKLVSIQSDINLLGVQIDAVNVFIMNKLYGIQGEITSVNDTLIGYLMNITNITANITLNQEAIFDDLVALWGDQIAKPSYYSAGLTGFLPSVSAQSDDTQYVCIDNYTLETRKTIFLETPTGNKTYVRTLQTTCTYGCINNTCAVPNYTLFIVLFVVIIIIYILYRHFFS